MQNLKIDTGEIELSINNDASRVIRFNPTDINFAERFYALVGGFEAKLSDFQARTIELDKVTDEDGNGLPANLPDRLALMREACEYMREQIDSVFGLGTSETVFGKGMSLDMFGQFFDGITPFIKKSRTEKMTQYQTPVAAKRAGRKNGK